MYTLDTNVIIYYSRGDQESVKILDEIFVRDVPLYVSAVTETEIFGFSNLTLEDIILFENFLKAVTVVPIDSRLARNAGSLRRQYKTKTIDSIIAATALMTNSTLLTRNLRDFKKIPYLRLQAA